MTFFQFALILVIVLFVGDLMSLYNDMILESGLERNAKITQTLRRMLPIKAGKSAEEISYHSRRVIGTVAKVVLYALSIYSFAAELIDRLNTAAWVVWLGVPFSIVLMAGIAYLDVADKNLLQWVPRFKERRGVFLTKVLGRLLLLLWTVMLDWLCGL